MLAQSHRLNSTEFARVFRAGRILRHPLLQGRVLVRADGADVVRAAFVAPKKIGKAVRRNRVRRRVRERFRVLGALNESSLQGCDLVFVIMPQAETATLAALDTALGELLRRAQRAVLELKAEAQRVARVKAQGVEAQAGATVQGASASGVATMPRGNV